MNEVVMIKVGSLEFTIEEARDLYKELGNIFGSKLVTLPPGYPAPLMPLKPSDPEYPVITC